MQELNISVTLGSLFYMKDLENVLEKQGLKVFLEEFKKMDKEGEFLPEGPSLGLIRFLAGVPGVKLSLISKLTADTEVLLLVSNSINHYFQNELGFNEFHQVIFCDGKDSVKINKTLGVELAITSNESSIKDFIKEGIPAIAIDTPCCEGVYLQEQNSINYLKSLKGLCLISDFDGVIGDSNSERVFQEAIKKKSDRPEIEFAKHEHANVTRALGEGPMLKLVKMISEHQKHSDTELHVVTARGGHSIQRAVLTLNKFGIRPQQVWFMAGANKNKAIEILFDNHASEKLTLFLDDSSSHYNRAGEISNLMSGLVSSELG